MMLAPPRLHPVAPADAGGAGYPALTWGQWRPAVAIAVVTVAVCAVVSFALPGSVGLHQWFVPGDAKWAVQGAQWVSHGAIGTVYQGDTLYLPLPGLLVLLAPVAALGDHLGLVAANPYYLPYPSMWELVGPVSFVLGSTCLLGADYLAETLGVPSGRRRLIAIMTGLTVVVPATVFAGHPEDLLALALSCLSLALLLRRRHLGAALAISVAVMMQPWAALLVPILVAATPAGRRARALLWSCALPGACAAMLFALDFADTWRSLVVQPMPVLGRGQHLPWWGLAGHTTVTVGSTQVHALVGSGPRSLAVVAALLAAAWVLRDPRPATIMSAVSVALLARGVFETQFWPYYVAPAAVLMALAAAATAPARRRWAVAGASAFVVHGLAAAAYDRYSLPAWLALAVLVGAGGLAIRLSYERPTEQPGELPAEQSTHSLAPSVAVGTGSA